MNKFLCTLLIALFAIGLTNAQTCADGTEQVELINNVLSNGEFPLVGESLFFDDFGESDYDNGNIGRTESPFMPSNGFEFGNSHLPLPQPGGSPSDNNPTRNAARINDGFYAVVAPAYIKDGWFQDDGWTNWWTPAFYETNPVYDYSGTVTGAAMVINAGNLKTAFYEREGLVQEQAKYRASFKLFVVQKEAQVGIQILDPVTRDVLHTSITPEFTSDFNVDNNTQWQDVSIEFTMPGDACDTKEVLISFRNHRQQVNGNDWYVDNIRLEKIEDAPACPPSEACLTNGITSVNLNDTFEGDVPAGASLVWFTTPDHSGNVVSDPENVTTTGTYYAFFYDAVNDCYNTNNSTSVVEVFIIEQCSADLSVVKTVNNETPIVEDIITFTLTATNLGTEDATNVQVTDQLPTGYTFVSATPSVGTYDANTGIWTIGDFANGATATLSMEVQVNAAGEYTNTATINGNEYDPVPDNNTSTVTVNEIVCFEPVDGEAFSWEDNGSAGSTVSRTITQPGTNGGFVFDIYELDNSFNMNINGVDLATSEIEFQSSGTPAPGVNIRFADGESYEAGTRIIWQMSGDVENPILRVIIDANGNVSMYGSKVSNGPLYPLELFNGNAFNNITWNSATSNNVVVTQNVVGVTLMNGYGYGQNIVPCPCTQPPLSGTPETTYVGVSTLDRNVDSWLSDENQNKLGAYIALESTDKAFVITRNADPENNIVNAVKGMLVWDTTLNCLRLYKGDAEGEGWQCVKQGCNQ